jgi:hypothetical protein
MTLQTISQLGLLAGIIMTALGGFGSYYFGKIDDAEKDRKHEQEQQQLQSQLTALQESTSQINANVALIFKATGLKDDVWTTIEMKNVPPGVTDYLLVLFATDKGRVTGKVRIKGSQDISSFSTTVNNTIPVVVRNLWVPTERQYKVPTVMEFLITDKTSPEASLSIYTAGYVGSAGREPH